MAPTQTRVLVFTRQLLPYSQTFVREQTLALRRWQPLLAGLEPVCGVDPAPLDHLLLQPTANYLTRLALRVRDRLWVAHPRHVQQLRVFDCALIHAHFGTSAAWLWPIARRLRLPMIVTLHGYDIAVNPEWWHSGAGGLSQRSYPQRLQALARAGVRFIAVSEGIRAQAIANGLPSERISVHYIGVDTNRFRAAGAALTQRARSVVFVGRLVEKKGCEYLLRAMARLREQVPDAMLTVIGDGPLQGELQCLAQQLQLPVHFVGALAHDAVRVHLDAARVVCVPSVRARNGDAEGLPIVLLEAASMGIPVVTSAPVAPGEGLVDGRTGFKVPEGDVVSLAERLQRVLLDDALAMTMSAAAAQFVRERYELAQCTRALEGLYDDAVREADCGLMRAAAPFA